MADDLLAKLRNGLATGIGGLVSGPTADQVHGLTDPLGSFLRAGQVAPGLASEDPKRRAAAVSSLENRNAEMVKADAAIRVRVAAARLEPEPEPFNVDTFEAATYALEEDAAAEDMPLEDLLPDERDPWGLN